MVSTKTIKTPTSVYAVVGAGDLAVEKLREVRLPRADVKTVQEQVQSQVQTQVKAVPGQVKSAPAKAQSLVHDVVNEAVTQANTVYTDLADRGKNLVTRIRRQQATQDLEAQLDTTVSSAKATSTTAKKAAKSTRTRAKATTTSARKTAAAANQATKKAAEKVGD